MFSDSPVKLDEPAEMVYELTTPEETIFSFLDSHEIKYERFQHEPVYTCPKMAEYLHTDEARIAKSMIMKKGGGGYLLAVLPGNMKVDFARLAKVVGARSVTLAPIEEAQKIAGCTVGSVHPLGNLLNLDTYFDQKLTTYDQVYFNPGSHTLSVKIDTRNLMEIVNPRIAEFAVARR
jgi:Ala-tRNA(Pro) deacylase